MSEGALFFFGGRAVPVSIWSLNARTYGASGSTYGLPDDSFPPRSYAHSMWNEKNSFGAAPSFIPRRRCEYVKRNWLWGASRDHRSVAGRSSWRIFGTYRYPAETPAVWMARPGRSLRASAESVAPPPGTKRPRSDGSPAEGRSNRVPRTSAKRYGTRVKER